MAAAVKKESWTPTFALLLDACSNECLTFEVVAVVAV